MQVVLVPVWHQEEVYGERCMAELCQTRWVRGASEWRSWQNWDCCAFKMGFPFCFASWMQQNCIGRKWSFWKRCDCFFVVFITHKAISPFPSPLPFPSFSTPPPRFFFFGCLPFFPFFFLLCSTFSKLFLAYNWTGERLSHSNYTYNFPLFVSTVDWEILFHLLYSESCHQPQRLRGDFWLAKDVFRALKPLRFFLYIRRFTFSSFL